MVYIYTKLCYIMRMNNEFAILASRAAENNE